MSQAPTHLDLGNFLADHGKALREIDPTARHTHVATEVPRYLPPGEKYLAAVVADCYLVPAWKEIFVLTDRRLIAFFLHYTDTTYWIAWADYGCPEMWDRITYQADEAIRYAAAQVGISI